MRLLMVEDDELLGSALHRSLMHAGYAVDWIQRGSDAGASLRTHEYSCVLLDLGLPDTPGSSVLTAIRRHNPDMPVVVMTARGGIQDRVALLDIGADDYMIKPIDVDELAARVRAVMRRRAPQQPGTDLTHGDLTLSQKRHVAIWRGEPVPLTKKEYWILETLLRRKNQVSTRSQLEDALYGWGDEINSNAVEVHISHLRRKFGPGLILNARGVGYQLAPERSTAE